MASSSSTITQQIFQEYPNLQDFKLQDVRMTGKLIGEGGYGTVEKAIVSGQDCAVKIIKSFYYDNPTFIGQTTFREVVKQYGRECNILASISHENIVQFVGMYVFSESKLPALVMELLHISLHNLVINKQVTLPLRVKCSLLCDVAGALKYLHSRTPAIIHGDLTAVNVVVSKEMKAKLIDLGLAQKPLSIAASSLSTVQETGIYTSPELTKASPSQDILFLGVLTIFVITNEYPNPLPSTYFNKKSKSVMARTEQERREEYMVLVREQLNGSEQLDSLVCLIEQCLQNDYTKIPKICEVMPLLESARGDQETIRGICQQIIQSPEWLQISAINE